MEQLRDAVRALQPPTAADLYESPGAYELVVDLPGAVPATTTVETAGDTLVVSAERSDEIPTEATEIGSAERANYHIELPLPADVDLAAVTGSLNHGVLELELPRSQTEETTVPIEDG